MTLSFPLSRFSVRLLFPLSRRAAFLILLASAFCGALSSAEEKKPVPTPAPDVMVLSNGDTLHGRFVSAVRGTVTFHCDPLGDISLSWDKIKEIRTNQKFAVVNDKVRLRSEKNGERIPVGTFEVSNQQVTVHPAGGAARAPEPVKDTPYIMDAATLNRQLFHPQSFLAGWSGSATAGATLVTATQNQYTVSGGIGLVRVAPMAHWLNPRNRTSVDFSGSFGKITQPGYYSSPGTYVAETMSKSAIYHADAEYDEYFSPRFYTLAQTAFDHNFSQNLDLQQVYGGGMGWTAIKTATQEADLKGTIQYEKQQFISSSASTNQNLVGSTLGANYVLHQKLLTYSQAVSFLPAYNNTRAYSMNETDSFTFPAYKNLGFTLGTIDTYLNDPPMSEPPTKRNSFQFTMGLTYTIKPKE